MGRKDSVVADDGGVSFETDRRMVYYEALQLLRTAARTERLRAELLREAVREADERLKRRADDIRRLLGVLRKI